MAADEKPSTGPSGLFRAEALEHRARARGPGDVIRVAPRWTGVAFYVLVGLFVVAFVAGLTFEIDRYARGTTAIDDQGRLVVLLPAALAPEVPAGRPVEIGDERAEVVSSDGAVLYPAEVRELYGVAVLTPSVAVVTSAQGSVSGEAARVFIEREPVLVALIPGLNALFGGDGA